MRLDDLTRRLEEAGLGVVGKTLFHYFMPDTANEGAMLRVGLVGATIDHELPGYRSDASFQLIVRSKRYDAGFDLTGRMVAALTVERPTVIGPYRFNYIRPRHEPIVYPRANGQNLEFSVTFDCNYVIL